MDYKTMKTEELLERRSAIALEVETEGADMNALEEEVRAINKELSARKDAAAKKDEIRKQVAEGAGTVLKTITQEDKKMDFKEFRNSDAYVNAYADFIKSGNDTEIRMLISANAPEGTEGNIVPVPTYLEERIQTAWERDEILSRVRKTFLRGNLSQSFELSATGAAVHAEGAANPPAEEELVIGTVTYIPEMVKKWITITDTVAKLKGREFLDYLYDEITYRVLLKAVELGIADIVNAPAASNATTIGVPAISGAPSVTVIPTAAANLSSEARDIVVIMNRLTEVEFLNAQVAGNFAVDPFAGLPKIYTSALPAYSAATSGNTYAIVGDLNGLQYNFPDGDDVEIIYDPYTLSENNRIKIVGRLFASHGVTAPGRFAKITK